MKRLLLLASGLLILAVFPATSAAASQNGGSMFAGTVPVRAYKMSLFAQTAGKNHSAFLLIDFNRGPSKDVQEHSYMFTKNVQVKLSADGGSGTIKANLGQFGQIKMTFSAGGGRITPGCPGSYTDMHSGTLSGKFHFISGNTYLKTVNESSIRAGSETAKKAPSCKPPSRLQAHGTLLQVSSFTIGAGTEDDFTVVRDTKGHTQEQFLVLDTSMVKEGVVIAHAVDVSGLQASAFTNSADLTSATALGVGQWLTGSLSFSGTPLGAGTAQGTVSGTITANFDGMPAVTLPSGSTTLASLSVS